MFKIIIRLILDAFNSKKHQVVKCHRECPCKSLSSKKKNESYKILGALLQYKCYLLIQDYNLEIRFSVLWTFPYMEKEELLKFLKAKSCEKQTL